MTQEVVVDSCAEPSRSDVAHLLAREVWAPWINGKSAPTGARQLATILDPATNEPVALVELAAPDDVDRAVAAAQQAFDEQWRACPAAERMRLLWAWADALAAHARELAVLQVLENGMPISRATSAVRWAVSTLRELAGWATKLSGITSDVGPDRFAYTTRHPLGVVGAIIPWNGPLASFVFKAAPALAAGCTIVIKPSELTPLTALHAVALAEQAGIPPGVINVVPGLGNVTGAHLARHPGVARVSFTGSTTTGRKIIEYSASNIKRLNLELGGKSPDVVFADADLDQAIPGVAAAIFNGAGQVCVAGSRILVEHTIYEEVVHRLVEHARRLVVGPGFDPVSEMGPLISRQQVERVHGYVEGAQRDGATVVLGGGGYDDEVRRRGNFYQPTIIVDVDPRMRIACEEVFGPVVTVVPFHSLDEAIALANATEYGLAGMVWTRDLSRAHTMVRAIRAGMLWVNCYHQWVPTLPHGALKLSGYGAKFGLQAVLDHTEERTVVIQL